MQVEIIDRFGLLPEAARFLFGVTGLKLRATPLGVRKIEAGPTGGRIIFEGTPKVDPTHIIRLVQTAPQSFKLDGGDRIRFFKQMSDREKRIDQVTTVLEQLGGG